MQSQRYRYGERFGLFQCRCDQRRCGRSRRQSQVHDRRRRFPGCALRIRGIGALSISDRAARVAAVRVAGSERAVRARRRPRVSLGCWVRTAVMRGMRVAVLVNRRRLPLGTRHGCACRRARSGHRERGHQDTQHRAPARAQRREPPARIEPHATSVNPERRSRVNGSFGTPTRSCADARGLRISAYNAARVARLHCSTSSRGQSEGGSRGTATPDGRAHAAHARGHDDDGIDGPHDAARCERATGHACAERDPQCARWPESRAASLTIASKVRASARCNTPGELRCN